MPRLEEKVSIQHLRECFEYRDGDLYWKARPESHFQKPADHKAFMTRMAGKKAGKVGGKGYVHIGMRINGDAVCMSAHRVVWAIHYGRWPEETIDHIDRNRTNNRIENLRDIPMAYNLRNRANASGLPRGVELFMGKPRARIVIGGVPVYLGTFQSVEDAHLAHQKVHAALMQTAKQFAPSVPPSGTAD